MEQEFRCDHASEKWRPEGGCLRKGAFGRRREDVLCGVVIVVRFGPCLLATMEFICERLCLRIQL